MKMSSEEQKPVFRDLSGDDPDPQVTEIESLCMNCHANGITRLLLTRIPYYKNVVIMSFSCEECGYANNEIQPGGAYAELGVRYTLNVSEEVDLNRQIVKSDYTSIRIPEVELEIPVKSQKGEVTTVEGIISRVIAGLTQDQRERRSQHGEAAAKIDEYIARLALLKTEGNFTLIIEDISGNSFVENPVAPSKDPRCAREDFKRSKEQDHTLGIFTQDELPEQPPDAQQWGSTLSHAPDLSSCTLETLTGDEVLQFPTNCPECNAPCETNMKVTKIPHFKEVVIMATVCDACGHRTNEVKSGSGIEDKGVRIEIRVASRDDFSRDVLKSETCSMSIPELDLHVGGRALGGRFTTVEGLLQGTVGQLRDAPGIGGDAPGVNRGGMELFLAKLQEVLDNKRAVTVILDDPAGNSYVQSLVDGGLDDGLKVTKYERTYEQNDELGLNDMKIENYEE